MNKSKVAHKEHLANDVYKITFSTDDCRFKRLGQFAMIEAGGLVRPFPVCDYDSNRFSVVFRADCEEGEQLLSTEIGTEVGSLTGLGNGSDLTKSGDAPLLVGGGVGVPPLYMLAKKLIAEGKRVSVILGFNTKEEVFFENEFRALGADVRVTTADGSYGIQGFVTDALSGIDYTYFYTCGPEPMLKALYRATVTGGQFSFEERMGCGFGACMGCSCKTVTGNKRICKEGPVLLKEDIIWEI